MTLQASGSMTGQNIRDELRQSGGNLVFPDATTRWLADKPSGNLTLPTDYYSKTAVKYIGANGYTSAGSSVLGGTIDLGPAFPGRMIVIIACAQASAGTSILQSSITLAGNAMTFGFGWQESAHAYSYGIAYILDQTNTTASYLVNFNRGATNLFAQVYSVAGVTTSPSGGSALLAGNSCGTTANISANGVVFMGSVARGAFGFTSNYGGATKITDSDIGGSLKFATGFSNRLSVETGRSMGCSMTGGSATSMSVAANSFN